MEKEINEKLKKANEEALKECPVTGMPFSGLVSDDDGTLTPVYMFSPYTSYTIPEYDEKSKEFIRRKYDEDEGCWDDGYESFCDLEELKEEVSKEKFEAIKAFYNIKDYYMEYTHPKRHEGVRSIAEHSQNIIRNRVERYCLKCDKFMGKDHDFSECETMDKWENGKVIKMKTCPFPHVAVSLIEPQVNCNID